jgi:hypothetical protein
MKVTISICLLQVEFCKLSFGMSYRSNKNSRVKGEDYMEKDYGGED